MSFDEQIKAHTFGLKKLESKFKSYPKEKETHNVYINLVKNVTAVMV